MSFLQGTDGTGDHDVRIPPLDLLVNSKIGSDAKAELSVAQIKKVMLTNAFFERVENSRNEKGTGLMKSGSIFGMVAFLNHSANANANKIPSDYRGDWMLIVACADIKAGEEVFIDYLGRWHEEESREAERAEALKAAWGIVE